MPENTLDTHNRARFARDKDSVIEGVRKAIASPPPIEARVAPPILQPVKAPEATRSKFALGYAARADGASGPTPLHFYDQGTRITTPESATTVRRIANKAGELLRAGSPMSPYYGAIRTEIDGIRTLARRIEARGFPQDDVAQLVHRYARAVEFPIQYINAVGHLADWGRDGLDTYSARAFAYARKEFKSTHGYDPDTGYLKTFMRKYVADNKRAVPGTSKSYSIEGMYDEKVEQPFFQYRYIFRTGEVPMIDFIRTRETGIVYVGVKHGTEGHHDGQRATNSMFVNHDYFHAYFQKVRDRQLFASLGITDVAGAARLKRLNQNEVESLLREIDATGDPHLSAAMEALLFGLFHEQAHSYPIQVAEELAKPDRAAFYTSVITEYLKKGAFGPRLKEALKGRGAREIARAIEWLLPRAEAARGRVLTQFAA